MEDFLLCRFCLHLFPLVLLLWFRGVESVTDPGDMAVLVEFKKGLLNPELLSEWSGDDACSVPWPHIVCQGARVSQIQVANLGLKGTLPPTLNRLSSLLNIGFQRNAFFGPLPSLNGLTRLSFAFVNDNQFDTIPEDFFRNLPSLESVALDNNPLNATTGWTLPPDITACTQLINLSLTNVGLTGKIPDFLGNMKSLQVLHLAYNKLDGGIPATFKQSNLRVLQANNQLGPILSGSIDAVGSMQSLSQLWLHVNNLTGVIPASLTNASSLTDIRLNDNHLVGPIPQDFQSLPLTDFAVQNNELNGPIPPIKGNFTYDGNHFCQTKPDTPCNPVVTALLEFLGSLNYPLSITQFWQGNDPCMEWTGITCQGGSVSILNLANSHLNGTISASLANISTLSVIKLNGNALTGLIPESLASLRSLKKLDLSNNQLSGPLPIFAKSVEVITDGNSLELGGSPLLSPSSSPSTSSQVGNPSSSAPSSGLNNNISSTAIASSSSSPPSKSSSVSIPVIIGPILAVLLLLLILPIVLLVLFKKKRRSLIRVQSPNTIVLHPREDGSNSDPDMVKIVVAGQNNGSSSSDAQSSNRGMGGGSSSSRGSEMQIVEAGHMVISIQVLRSVTDNFSEDNILGRGGFGAVYKGELHDGTKIAVKRMEAGIISSSKGLNEFQAEIAVLSKVRHRHLVALLGYCIDGNERLLVYEHMPLGPLSKYLFEWAKKGLKPLDWKTRLTIALDVARGMEYLHGLAHKSFIHRDLKPSNILLSDDYRAKVSDFGLVKLAPEGKHSIETRLAGTFGYLAPEYAATGRVTTKSDVFSFGVVLMELITGRRALDDTQPEDSMHLVSWFRRRVHASKDCLRDSIDPAIELSDEGFEESGISTVAELAGHCTHREPSHRPDMGHVVSVLVPLLEHWKKPCDPDLDLYGGIDLEMTLPQALKKWQAYEGNSASSHGGIYDTNESLPTCPTGFADSFTSADGR